MDSETNSANFIQLQKRFGCCFGGYMYVLNKAYTNKDGCTTEYYACQNKYDFTVVLKDIIFEYYRKNPDVHCLAKVHGLLQYDHQGQ